MYSIRVSHLAVLLTATLLLLTACGGSITTSQALDATTQTPKVQPSETPVPPTPPPTITPTPFRNLLAYELPGMEQVEVRSVEYRRVDGAPYFMDIYYPPQMAPDEHLPVVIFVQGFTNEAAIRLNGVPNREFGPLRSWGRLVAAAGMIGVTYDTDLWDDLDHVVQTVRQNGDALHMDPARIGLWSASGTSLTASSFAMQDDHDFLSFALFYYGFMLTPDNFRLAELQQLCRDLDCYVPDPDDDATGLPGVEQIRTDLPLLIARAGRDVQVNGFIDHFVDQATAAGAQLTVLDHPEGVHAFDFKQKDHERSSEIIAQTLEFMSANFAQP